MNDYPYPLIAREGWPFLAMAIVVAVGLTFIASWAWAAPVWLIVLFMLQFFRDPPRAIGGEAGSVLAPSDGRIVAIAPTHDPWLNRQALKISVFMNVFNVHANRSPVDGQVRGRWYHPGAFVNAAMDKASIENERNALHLVSDYGAYDVTCVQVAGLIARRILCYVDAGTSLTRGQRYGFIRFGSRVDVYLPLDARPRVVIGDKVSAAVTVLADLPPVQAG